MTKATDCRLDSRPLVILGAGRQGRNVNDVCLALGRKVSCFLDDTKTKGDMINGVIVKGGFTDALDNMAVFGDVQFFVAIGDCRTRYELSKRLETAGASLATVVDPRAAISPFAKIGRGVFINAYSRVLANAVIGDHCLIEGLCTVGCDAVLESGVWLGPAVQLTAGARIGSQTLIGANAGVISSSQVGKNCQIAAGSMVISDIPDNVLATGLPATVKRHL